VQGSGSLKQHDAHIMFHEVLSVGSKVVRSGGRHVKWHIDMAIPWGYFVSPYRLEHVKETRSHKFFLKFLILLQLVFVSDNLLKLGN